MVLAGRSRLVVAAAAVVTASAVAVFAATSTTAAVVARPAATMTTVRDAGEMDCEPEMDSTPTPGPPSSTPDPTEPPTPEVDCGPGMEPTPAQESPSEEPGREDEPSAQPEPTEQPTPEMDCGPGMEPTPAQESPSEEPGREDEPSAQPEPTESPPPGPELGDIADPSNQPEPSKEPEMERPPQGKENGGPFRFYLVDTDTGADVGGALESPVTLQAADLPAAWSLRADRRDGTDGGVPVEFRVDGSAVQVEHYPPYMLAGNDGDVVHGWDDAPPCGTGWATVGAEDMESKEMSTLRVRVAC